MTHTLVRALAIVALLFAVPLRAQPALVAGPCSEVRAACEHAGFVRGGVKVGNGVWIDCVRPIIEGGQQPPRAGQPLPQIDPQVVARCRASNPNFGQGRATPPSGPVSQRPLAGPSQPSFGGPCAQITAACERAGFVRGGFNTGIGLQADCVRPIIEGRPQPSRASRPLPPINPQVAAACAAERSGVERDRAAAPRPGPATPLEPLAQPIPASPPETLPQPLPGSPPEQVSPPPLPN
jgi:hypothetical protein